MSQKIPLKNPAVEHKVAKFGDTPLMIKPVDARMEPVMAVLQQPTLSTRYAPIGPTKYNTPVWVEDTMEVTAWSVPNVSMNSLRNMPNV